MVASTDRDRQLRERSIECGMKCVIEVCSSKNAEAGGILNSFHGRNAGFFDKHVIRMR
jgi:hypothetical protein